MHCVLIIKYTKWLYFTYIYKMKSKCTSIIIVSPGKKVKVHNNEHICLTLQRWAWCHIQT